MNIRRYKREDSQRRLQWIILVMGVVGCLLAFLLGNYIVSSHKGDGSQIMRTTNLSSISFKSPKKELDIKMADPAMSKMWGIYAVQAQKAWTQLNILGHHKVVVAVIDTGIDKQHLDLQKNLWVNTGETGLDKSGKDKRNNGKDDDENGCVDDVHGCNFINMTGDISDSHGHGTHIAGIIGATQGNGVGVSGVAPNVSMMILKYYEPKRPGFQNLTNTIKAIHYAIDHGAHIINYSGGGTSPSLEERKAIERAHKKGILFVTAAGNEKSNLDLTSHYYPADYPLDNIISVTAFDRFTKILPTSNYGASTVDIAAPGNQILSTLPGDKYGYMTGTSQATAFVTGVATLILSRYPDFSFRQIIKHLTVTGDLDMNLNGKTIHRKRLNTYRALAMLGQGVSATGIIADNVPSAKTFSLSNNQTMNPKSQGGLSQVSTSFEGINFLGKSLGCLKFQPLLKG